MGGTSKKEWILDHLTESDLKTMHKIAHILESRMAVSTFNHDCWGNIESVEFEQLTNEEHKVMGYLNALLDINIDRGGYE